MASLSGGVHIWNYTSNRYTPWREFPVQGFKSQWISALRFSPTSSSILIYFDGAFQVYRFDSPPVIAHPRTRTPLVFLSPSGTYMASAYEMASAVAITNPLSQTTSQLIYTGMEIRCMALTGNILLVCSAKVMAAWRLTEEGLVDGVFGGRRAGYGDSIWAVLIPDFLVFTFDDQTVTIEGGENVIHVYHTGTGEVLEPALTLADSHNPCYCCHDLSIGLHLHCHNLDGLSSLSADDWEVSSSTLRKGWIPPNPVQIISDLCCMQG